MRGRPIRSPTATIITSGISRNASPSSIPSRASANATAGCCAGAILWHEAVYEPGQKTNEQRSAELAAFELSRCGVAEEDCAEAVRLILLTERHRTDQGDRLGSLMISIDLAILGSDPERYNDYAAGVRREYGHVPDELWRTGRSLVLSRLLEADPLYPDHDFGGRLEAQAHANMEAEISRLGEG